jgi:site-specific DNA-adenine methylase
MLQRAVVMCGDFEATLGHVAAGDFVYMDPHLHDGKAGKDSAIFRNISQAERTGFMGRQIMDRRLFKRDITACGRNHTHHAFKGCAFTGTVTAQHHNRLTTVNFKAQIKQDLSFTIEGAHLVYLQNRFVIL